ncbi:MAG: DEAD/DEAH box helicase [Treponema sp.]|uniref:DEAD/DEAH box helicase n=1 Tax=Treponema sp. TaxID=166 RepID=UPI00298E1A08|nr:DEAD/DEAH box helicase [Treponema sp.]MCQ2601162.1 DEAD/DEAH box helicase [Treponema sp.]
MEFREFNLDSRLMEGIQNAGYVNCTPVQEQVIAAANDGSDLYVQSQTGTGKTAAYLIAVMQEILTKPELAGKKVLVLVPTRELAVQVEMECKTLCEKTGLKPFSFYGGVGYEKQVNAIEKGVDILLATPGRVIDLQEQKKLDLSNVGFAIIDEADRMFDMGFYPDLRIILKHLPKAEDRQTMLFSATLNTYVKNLAWEYTRDAKEITIEAENITVDEIDQELIHVSSDEKTKLLVGILTREKPESTIIFCNTKKGCEIIGKRLSMNGFSSEYIIGDMQQSRRLKVLNDFKEGKVSILVATDVAARGIDVNDLAMVVNYDLPNEPENYVHRIGRTARAGKSGKAYTFCSEKDVYDLMPIERYIGKSIPSRVCNSEMLGEDKSEGVYIKLDSYGEDRRDDRRGGDRRNGRDNRNGDRRRGGKGHDGNRRNGDNKNHASNYKKDGYNKNKGSREEKQDLSNLTFEERMEVYKKKYATSSEGKKSYDSKNSKNKKYNNKNNKKNNNRPQNNGNKSNVKVYDSSKKGVQSQGLFARIKAFFSRKGK